MQGRTLSIFIDESGDFGAYEEHAPYYIISAVLHNQNINISEDINRLESYLLSICERRPIHTGPLIRRESDYKDYDIARRRMLFNAIFNFARRVDIHYTAPNRKCSYFPFPSLVSEFDEFCYKLVDA